MLHRLPLVTRPCRSVLAGASPAIELLRAENQLLKDTLTAAQLPLDEGADGVVEGGEVPPTVSAPEEYWMPAVAEPKGGAFVEQYGTMQPLPNHDGTECFKWDSTLQGAAGHFRVCKCAATDRPVGQRHVALSHSEVVLSLCGGLTC